MLASIVVQSDSHVASHPPKRGYGAPRDAFLSVVPVFAKYSNAANSTLFVLFGQFLAKCSEVSNERDKMELYSCMVNAIMAIPPEYVDLTAPVGSFVAAFLAFDVQNDRPVISKNDTFINGSSHRDSAFCASYYSGCLIDPADWICK
jgi:hypothetical protein